MMAKACGARIRRAPEEEIGWSTVTLTREGLEDPLFRGLPERLPVFQWHEDTFDLPEGGILLATSRACPHQAFRWGSGVGLQFHLEVTPSMLREWFSDPWDADRMIRQYRSRQRTLLRNAKRLCANFLLFARERNGG